VNDLQAAHILPDAIGQYTKSLTASGTANSAPPEQGFWAGLFGSEHDTSVYDRSVASRHGSIDHTTCSSSCKFWHRLARLQ
jgi:hypothetical protein